MNKQIIIVYILLLSFCSFAGVVQVVPLSGGGGSITNLSGLTFSNVVLTNSTFYGNATGTFYGNIIPTNNNFITTNNIYTYLTNVVVSPFLSDSYTIVSSPTYNINFTSANTIHLNVNGSTTFTESGWPNSDTNFNDSKILVINNVSTTNISVNFPSWSWTSSEGFIPAPTNINSGTSISISLSRYINYSIVITVANPTYFTASINNNQFGTAINNSPATVVFLTNTCLIPAISSNTVISYTSTNTYMYLPTGDSYTPPSPQWTLYLANGFYRYYVHNEMYSVTNTYVTNLAVIISAINTLVTNLVANNLYTNLYAFYPFVGSYSACTATNADRFNLISSSYPLTFNNFYTNFYAHTFLGLSNSIDGFADTSYTLNNNSNSMFGVYLYSFDYSSSGNKFIGNYDTLDNVGSYIYTTNTPSIRFSSFDNTSQSTIVPPYNLNTNKVMFAISRLSNSLYYAMDDTTITNISSVGFIGTYNSLYIGSINNLPLSSGIKPYTISSAFFGSGMTTNQLNTLRTIILTFNTTLGR